MAQYTIGQNNLVATFPHRQRFMIQQVAYDVSDIVYSPLLAAMSGLSNGDTIDINTGKIDIRLSFGSCQQIQTSTATSLQDM